MRSLNLLKGRIFLDDPTAWLALGPPGLGLRMGHLHEIVPGGIFHLGAAAGFALGLVAQLRRPGALIWVQQDMAALEGGQPYGPGGALFGFDPARLLLVRTATAKDALWAMEESLRCPGIAAVIGELSGAGDAADLTATRRLNLAIQAHGAFGLLLRQQPLRGTSACASRWVVRAAHGRGDGFGGIGRTAFALTLEKNRHGPCGDFTLEWHDDERCFRPALPVAVAAPAADRPHRAA
jgi:protein ImuA